MNNVIRGYKVFNSDWTCLGFKFEVGQTYSLPEGQAPIPCKQGFHFCEVAVDCFNYYTFDPSNKVAIVEAVGEVVTKGDKSCTNSLYIVEEVSWEKLLTLVNTGKGNSGYRNSGHYNSGYRNSGDYNSGYRNSGHYNSGDYNSGLYNSGDYNSGYRNSGHYNSGDYNFGDYNSGDRNSGYYNSGDYNSGDYNSGDRNSGDRNSGHYNSGDYNSGDYNSGDYNSGYCNSDTPVTVRVFNKEIERAVWKGATIPAFFNVSPTRFIFDYGMTKEEKEANKGWENIGGYLKIMEYKEAWQESYRKTSQEDRDLVKQLPNFDADVFFEITGIRVE